MSFVSDSTLPADVGDDSDLWRNWFEDSPIPMTFEDWSDVKRIVDRLRSSGVKSIVEHISANPRILAELAPAARILDVNSAAVSVYKAASKQALLEAFNAPPDLDSYNPTTGLSNIYATLIERFSAGETRVELEGPDTTLDGSIIHIRTTTSIGRGHEEDWGRVLQTVEDITKRKNAETALSFQATHDALTGLSNRREFEDRLKRALDAARTRGHEHAICFLDLDQFKVINDTCGHMAGDELLRQLGQSLSASVRQRDTLARLGGDEFGVLMEHCTLAQARRVADKIHNAVANFRFVWDERVFHIGVSIGLVPISRASESVANLMSAADSACYAAKDAGRNRIHVYHLDDSDLAHRQGEMRWVARIHQAVEEDRLQLWSQPIVPVKEDSDKGKCFELLLRLVDERGDRVLPEVFLPAAERYGLGAKLDRWVVGTALRWLGRNPALLEELHRCFINLSGSSLADEEFLGYVHHHLENSRVPSEKICFEITETAAITNLSRAMTFMTSLNRHGCKFALDDFGSGLSSFAYLRTLPVDYLKIDGSFVKDIVEDKVDLALVRAINDIGKVMGKQTIAESVENEDILQRLREIGMDYAQGYGIGRPTPIGETRPFNDAETERLVRSLRG